MPRVELTETILAPLETVYDLTSNMEGYPEYMKNVISVQVLERFPGKTITYWIMEVEGMKMRWRELDEFFTEEKTIRFHLLNGDLDRLEGHWTFEDRPEGTHVIFYLDFDLGVPMLNGLFHYLLLKKVRENCQDMLLGLKEKAETKEVPLYYLKS